MWIQAVTLEPVTEMQAYHEEFAPPTKHGLVLHDFKNPGLL